MQSNAKQHRPWWKWNVITLFALLLCWIGIGYATTGKVGALIGPGVSILIWILLPILAFPTRWLVISFCFIFGRYSRFAFSTIAVSVVVSTVFAYPYLCHFAATGFVWRTGGHLQYAGGKYIGNVIASQDVFRKNSGETWKSRFRGPVVSVQFDPSATPIPMWLLKSFPELEYLANIRLNGSGMRDLSDFSRLDTIVIAADGNLDSGLIHLVSLPHLANLRLNGEWAISDDGVRTIANVPTLKGLWIESQLISDKGLKHLAKSSVTRLVLESSKITDNGLLNLQGMKLETLVVESKQISNEGILAIRRAIPGLITSPAPQPINSVEMSIIDQLQNRRFGDFRWKLDDEGRIGEIAIYSLVDMHSESATSDVRSTDHHLTNEEAELLKQFPNLTRLSITSRNFSDRGLEHLRWLRKLKELSVEMCPINGQGFSALPRPSSLEILDLSKCPIVTENFQHFEDHKELTTLILTESPISDVGLSRLPSLPNLQNLLMESCQISDRGVAELARFPGLKYLNLFGNEGVTDESISTLEKLRELEELNLHATGVTKTGVARLQVALPDCQIYFDEESSIEDQQLTGA
jgi:hypothetical protein